MSSYPPIDPASHYGPAMLAMAEWLQGQPQDVWLVATADINWGIAVPLLQWVIAQPQCDLGVAAQIFWLGSTSDVADPRDSRSWHDDDDDEYHDLVRAIARNAAAGRYRDCRLAPFREEVEIEMEQFELLRRTYPGLVLPFAVVPALLGPFGAPPTAEASAFQSDPAVRALFAALGTDFG